MQEALKRMKEEEERLRLEEEAKIKAAEEAERQRQEKVYKNFCAVSCKYIYKFIRFQIYIFSLNVHCTFSSVWNKKKKRERS